jgi:hypothetical protein
VVERNPEEADRLGRWEEVGVSMVPPPHTQRQAAPTATSNLALQLEAQMRPQAIRGKVLSAFQCNPEAIGVSQADGIDEQAGNPMAAYVFSDTQMSEPDDLAGKEVQRIANDMFIMDCGQ